MPATASLALLAVWAGVAHASGSGWVQALAALAGGVVLVGLVGPGIAVGGIEVEVQASPNDATSGESLELTVVATRSCRCYLVRPKGLATLLQAGRPTTLELRPDRRGVLAAVDLKVASAAPFGLFWWAAKRRVALPHRVLIAPARSEEDRSSRDADPGEDGSGAAQLSETGERRGAREYRVGDSPRHVDWRSTAHTGSLMVRESEVTPERPVHVIANLADDADVAEVQASAVMSTVASLLGEHRSVVLETTGPDGRQRAAVRDERDAGRRMARAGRNPWGALGPAEPLGRETAEERVEISP